VQSDPALPARPAVLSPVQPGERILTLDVLRGIALFGVLAANIWLWFSGIYFRFPDYMGEVWGLSVDALAFQFIAFFISGKAITTFSLLFGLGFAIQMMRAEARGRSIVGHHAKRLAILLLFGVVHAVFLWYGDILTAYALLGFGLLLFRKRRDRTLVVWAAVLIAVVPVVLGGVPLVMSAVSGEAGGPEPATALAEMAERNGELLALFQSGEPAQIVRGNLRMLRQQWLTPKSLFLLNLFGVFLLGVYAGRKRIFEHPAAHRPLLGKLVVYGFGLGIAGSAVATGLRTIPPEQAMGLAWMPLAGALAATIGIVPFALAYMAAATLLLERARWRRVLGAFAPVGRMALTNYLAQTVICLAIYYQGGLVGRAGPFLGLVLAVVVFAVQMVVSAWWLARFRFGPMEWLWRSLTYGRLQPMRLAPPQVAGAEPA
jgi:uncharacterized protein